MNPEPVAAESPRALFRAGAIGMPEQGPPSTMRDTRPFGLPAAPVLPFPLRLLTPSELAAPPAADAVTSYVVEMPERARVRPEDASATADAIVPVPAANQPYGTARGLNRRILARALAYIEEHLGDNFTLEDLAKAAGVSRFHFARLFRVSTGESPMGYCLHLRVERAKGMLLEGNSRMCDIAVALGFFDQSHFSRTFRRIAGVSPGEYVRMAEVAEVAF